MHDVEVIEDPAAAAVALDPMRARLLAELVEPGSAATVAARVGLARQKVNYHLKTLEAHGLVELTEERRARRHHRARAAGHGRDLRRVARRARAERVRSDAGRRSPLGALPRRARRPHRARGRHPGAPRRRRRQATADDGASTPRSASGPPPTAPRSPTSSPPPCSTSPLATTTTTGGPHRLVVAAHPTPEETAMTTPRRPPPHRAHSSCRARPSRSGTRSRRANGISAWLLPTDLEPRVGGAVEFHMGDDSSKGTVTGYDPPRRIAYEEPDWAALVGHAGADGHAARHRVPRRGPVRRHVRAARRQPARSAWAPSGSRSSSPRWRRAGRRSSRTCASTSCTSRVRR